MNASNRENLLRSLPLSERPREKLLYRGEEFCSDEELLSALIRSGSRGASALDLARKLLGRFGGLSKLQQVRAGELTRMEGFGESRAAAIVSAFALGRRASRLCWKPGEEFRSSRQVFQHFRDRLMGLQKERFYALHLDGKNRLVREDLVSEGTLTASVVHPREVFGPAIREGAASVIVLHNHPSGDPQPSPEDFEVTRRLRQAGGIVGILLLDHLVLGRESYYSFQEKGKL